MALDQQHGLMNAVNLLVNSAFRRIETMFPGYFSEAKHNHYGDYGWPSTITPLMLYQMYSRNGLATAAVDKTILKTWEDNPQLIESDDPEESPIEAEIRQWFDDLRIWQKLAEADRRSLVGRYSGVILRIADGQSFDKPVTMLGGGLSKLVEIIPAWSMQLIPSQWEQNVESPNYGQPTMYQFQESALGSTSNNGSSPTGQGRAFNVHPDRVLIWSKDSTLFCKGLLEPGYNDLLTMEKVSGAGGEGFWKNAKSSPVLEIDKEANIQDMARAMGVTVDKVADAMNEQVTDWQRGFDKVLMLQGMKANTVAVNLPSPEHFFNIALQCFASSVPIPLKILVGMQTGERASSEDAKEWNQTNKSRRVNQIIPSIRDLVKRLERFGILPKRDWIVEWKDLTGSTLSEQIDIAAKMSEINSKSAATRELVFLPEEIRSMVDMQPLSTLESRYPDGDLTNDPGLPPDPNLPAGGDPPADQ